ncbi:GntR family transcriptional regulator [Pseudomonas putida]|uniref:GntR family transcriptional regulator n=1 Tax=Pseudomonas putida TaxID=303 RepID=UPI00300F5B91
MPHQKRSSAAYKTRAQLVAEDIRRRIIEGEFGGGFQLRQDALAGDYGVSRIPVREALLTLEAEGLVEFHPHRGAFTTELSSTKIRELFELRALLEVRALAHSIPNLSASALEKAEHLLNQYNAALSADSEIDNWSDFNFGFHEVLYSACGMPETLAMIAHLNVKSDRYIRMQLIYTQETLKAELEHRQLLELARSGEVKEACRLLEAHITDACEGIVAVFERSLGNAV